ncbi:hypothetical protein ACH4TV_14460 [Streptomyces sp. NPDC020898]|uniref:hypothetical protein n=1 Tax=Streptomyces sp. NPDC020898 TaxID=3365101 RepID=UPI0037A81DEF
MKSSLLRWRAARRGHGIAAVALTAAAAALGVSMFGGGPVDRPGRPGEDLAEQLDVLRGANDLVRATRADVGHDPALYPTAYGRLEAALPGIPAGRLPGIQAGALADLARTDVLDTPAWRAHYVCLSLEDSEDSGSADAATVLERAGLREQAGSEALAYLRAPDEEDDALTSLTTRAAFLRTSTCLGRDDEVPRAVLDRLAADAASAAQPVPVLYTVEALRAVGVRAHATRALRGAGSRMDADCVGLDPIQRAALALLRHRLTRQAGACLLPALCDSDTQTRWLVRRALALGAGAGAGAGDPPGPLPAPVGGIRPDGLVAKSPAQMGTLTATYNAARALTAAARQTHTPDWLTKRLKRLGSDPGLDPSDRVPLAMTCHRLALACGPEAEKGARAVGRLAVPARLTTENQRVWYGAMAARAEFGLGCPRTSVELPPDEVTGTVLSDWSLRTVVVLADAGCAAQAERLTAETDLVAQARQALRDGDLLTASDAVQAALASAQSIPQSLWDELPGLLEPYRDRKYPDLYGTSPGGAATADATRAAYYLLA